MQQQLDYKEAGAAIFKQSCATCHGAGADGGKTAPTLHSKEFLSAISDEQIVLLVSGGVTGSSMPAWSIDFGGPLTSQQIHEVASYLRTLEPNAPSIPDWRRSAKAK